MGYPSPGSLAHSCIHSMYPGTAKDSQINDPLSGGNQSPAEPDSRVAGIVPLGGSVCRG